MGVSELVSEFLAELSKHFNNVYFVSVAGNHSRINPSKDQSLASERLDDLIEWYIRARLQNFENVHFECNKIDNTMYTINVRGKTYCGIHGDYALYRNTYHRRHSGQFSSHVLFRFPVHGRRLLPANSRSAKAGIHPRFSHYESGVCICCSVRLAAAS